MSVVRRHRAGPVLLALLSLPGARSAVAQGGISPEALGAFDAYVARAVTTWRIPGLAIAVVQGDSILFAKGYGVRTLGTGDSVRATTLFANASTTKAFTAMAAAMMVDAGKLHWNDKVAALLPGFALGDPETTNDLSFRDLLEHHTGFGDPEYLWYGHADPLEEMIRRLRFVHPVPGLRTGHAYNNVTYGLAGYLEGRIDGSSWEDLVHRRIHEPLGMRETVPNTAGLHGRSDVATPHFLIDDTVRVIPRYDLDNIAPAGAMYSSVRDMARWIRFLLAGGRTPQGERLVSDSSFAELFKPQVLIPAAEFYPTARVTKPHFTGYGLGWFLEDYRGEFVAMHTGSIDGMSALVGLLPERKVGMVVFANLDHAELRHALMFRVFDLALGGAARDWSAEFRTLYGGLAAQARAAEAKLDSARVTGTRPSLPLARYAGTYADSLYGRATVLLEDDHLVLAPTEPLTADLMHWHYDTFRASYRRRWLGRGLVTFRLGADGGVAALDLGDGRVLARVR